MLWLALRARGKEFEWEIFRSTFAGIHWGWFSTGVALVLLTYLGRAIRWQVMLRPIKPKSSFSNLLIATTIGFTAVVLFGRAGELVRPYLIANKEKVPFSSQLAAWFLERIYDLLSVLLLFGFALAQITGSSTHVTGHLATVLRLGGHTAGALATLCLALLVTFGLFPNFVENRLLATLSVLPEHFRARIESLVRGFLAGTSSTRQGSIVFLLVLYTFCEWLIIVGCFLCIFKAIPVTQSLGILDTLIVVGFVAFGSAVQIPGIGGGMQVATVVVLTELFRVPLESASGIAILIWVVTFVSVVPIGLVLAVRDGLEFRKLMNIKEMKSL
ncbi:MAG: flippase-like domain-containing protein [Bryobacterales bacterium]|nr:flippase-like domain-containing protein [Bryobacterales bacterium]